MTPIAVIWIYILLSFAITMLIILFLYSFHKNSSSDIPRKPKRNLKDVVGSSVWLYLHAIADNYPSQPTTKQQQDFVQHVGSFANCYPCATCAHHMSIYIEENPLHSIRNRTQAVKWMYNFHNDTNIRLGKNYFTAEEYLHRYERPDFEIVSTIEHSTQICKHCELA